MISQKKEKEKSSIMREGMVKCSLCGHFFQKGQKNACGSCPLNYGTCNFEKCPHCGYDVPQGSYLWTFAAKTIDKIKKVGKK